MKLMVFVLIPYIFFVSFTIYLLSFSYGQGPLTIYLNHLNIFSMNNRAYNILYQIFVLCLCPLSQRKSLHCRIYVTKSIPLRNCVVSGMSFHFCEHSNFLCKIFFLSTLLTRLVDQFIVTVIYELYLFGKRYAKIDNVEGGKGLFV